MAWRIAQHRFDPKREPQMESLFTVGNGYLGVRGALDLPLARSQGDLFIAGLYDRRRPEPLYPEAEVLAPDQPYAQLVALPFPFRLKLSLDGEPLALRRVLDTRGAVLEMECAYEGPGGERVTLRSRRCASLADPHLLLQEASVDAAVTIEACLDEPQAPAAHRHLERIEHMAQDDVELVRYRTRACACACEICIVSRVERGPRALRRVICVFTGRDTPDPRGAALAHLESLGANGFEHLFAAHRSAWAGFWAKADVRVPDRPHIEQALRFGSYHLRSAAGRDPRTSIGARALTGRAYEGHVLWDAEIFMLPFYLHTQPELARNLLLYRHRTLDGARRHARALGCRGASFAWESSVTGDDVTPAGMRSTRTGQEIPIFTGMQEIHVTADVAYAVWRYWEATRDEAFLAGPGAELLFETARFWASRVVRRGSRHHILGVVGPDEYHHDVDDNAYTNWMARFNLERAAWAAQQFGVHEGEAQEWSALARSLYGPARRADGVIEQFDGFFELAEHALPRRELFKTRLHRRIEGEAEKINRCKLVKQADVLMLPLLFPEDFSDEVVAANYRYYEPMTDHGSSLSPAVHAAIASRIGSDADAHRYWHRALRLDLADVMDNGQLGVHPATMGGAWQALVFGFLGVRFTDAGPQTRAHAAQRLPAGWERVELSLAWRGRTYPLAVGRS